MATATTILARGDMLGGYRIDDIIGLGGMAIVYRAEQVSLGRQVALKVLSPRLSADVAFQERFRREGMHVAALHHPNVVTIFDSGEADGRLYMAMRLVDGTTLAERIHQPGLSGDQTLSLLTPVAAALDAAHAAGLVHRDVKPQNILLDADDHPYLADFGVAQASSATHGLTSTGGFVGSINYASPEQILGTTQITAASDVYSLTAVLYQCLTGQAPYLRETDAGVMHAHLHDPPPSIQRLTEGAEDLDEVIARGMAKDPADRYGRASDLLSDGRRALGALSAARRGAVPVFPLPAERNGSAAPARAVPPAPDGPRDRPRPVEVTGGAGGEAPPAARPGDRTEIVEKAPAAADRRGGDLTRADRQRAAAAAVAVAVPKRRWSAWLKLGACIAVVGAIAVVALLAGGGGSSPGRIARSGPLAVAYGSPWTQAGGPVIGSAALSDPIRLVAGPATFAAGTLVTSAPAAGSVPPALVSRYGRRFLSGDGHVGGLSVRRYVWTLTGGRSAIASVVSAQPSDLAVICAGATTAQLDQCRRLAAGMRLTGVRTVPPGPDQQVLTVLTGALTPVAAARLRAGSVGAARLAARRRPVAVVAGAESSAANALGAVAMVTRTRRLVAALRDAIIRDSAAFARLSGAASANNPPGYDSARTIALAADAKLAAAVAALRSAGYPVTAIPPLALAPAPAAPKQAPPAQPAGPVTPVVRPVNPVTVQPPPPPPPPPPPAAPKLGRATPLR